MTRGNIKSILCDPVKRRVMMARAIQAIQAREGRDLSMDDACAVYDRCRGAKKENSPQ